ncbi:MAG: enoyl-CoA hydratase/isomerase family protein [Burkholderiaceae bacterium]
MSQEDVLLREERDGIACITLNRPRVLNALNSELRAALCAFWEYFRRAEHLKVAIVTGAGDRAFSTGRDFKETAAADVVGERLDYEESGGYGYPGDFRLGKPVIAAISGHCLAAGLMIAITSDIRICAPNARFGNPQVTRGRGTRMPLRLTAAGLPRGVVLDMTMTGRSLDADEALRWGLVSRVVPAGTLLDSAWEIARTLAGNSPVVVGSIKRASEAGLLDLPINEAMRIWDPFTGMMENTADAIEGARSFVAKEKARFAG